MGISNHLYIITGSLRGLGQSIIEQLLLPTHSLICISANHDQALKSRAQTQGAQLVQWQQDLSDSLQASRRLSDWLGLQPPTRFKHTHLIHINDGWLPARPLRDMGTADIAHIMRSNLETPISLTAAFLKATRDWPQARKVMLISPFIQTQHAPYRAAQMALNEFVELGSTDEAHFPYPTRLSCVNIAPSSKENAQHTLPSLAQRSLAHLHSREFGHEPSMSWSAEASNGSGY